MKQIKLLTIFHQDDDLWRKTYDSLYNSPLSRHIGIPIKQFTASASSPAFFYYTEDMARVLTDITKEVLKLNTVALKIPGVAIDHFQRSCLIEEIKSSNDIEGVHSTRKEITDAMDEQGNPAAFGTVRLWGIVNKYTKLMKGDTIDFSDSRALRAFYDDFILEEVVRDDPNDRPDGKVFRCGSVDVLGRTKIIHKGILPEASIIKYMNAALALLHDEEIPDLIRVSVFHYLFGYIHPFYNGNGRTSRFITSYYLSHTLSPLVAMRLSITIKKSSRIYYKLFEDTNAYGNKGDLTPFITGFLWLILRSISRVVEILSEKESTLHDLRLVLDKRVSASDTDRKIYYILLQAALFSAEGATLSEIAQTVGKTDRTIRNKLKDFPKQHIVINKEHKSHRFKLNLDALLDE